MIEPVPIKVGAATLLNTSSNAGISCQYFLKCWYWGWVPKMFLVFIQFYPIFSDTHISAYILMWLSYKFDIYLSLVIRYFVVMNWTRFY